MTAIDRAAFAAECLVQARIWGAWAHYMVAVAELRSKIDDATAGIQHGPFRITAAQWAKCLSDPQLANYKPSEIDDWVMQCAVFARWMHMAQESIVQATGTNPSVEQVYSKQYPGEPVAGLDTALSDTASLIQPGTTIASASSSG